MSKTKSKPEAGEQSPALMHHPFLAGLKVRWVRGLNTRLGLTHGDTLLACMLAEAAVLPGGVKHCGGSVSLVKDIVVGFLSGSYWTHIKDKLRLLAEKGVISPGARVSNGRISAFVTSTFASMVYGRGVVSIGDLRVADYDFSPGTPFARATAAAKVALMVWRSMVLDGRLIETDSSIRSFDQAYTYPRTRMMSVWLGVSPKHFRAMRSKYAGILWDTADVYMLRNGTVSWDRVGDMDKYCTVIRAVRQEVLHADPRQALIGKIAKVISAYTKLTFAVLEAKREGYTVPESVESMWGDVDATQFLHDWKKQFIEGDKTVYKASKATVERLYDLLLSHGPVPVTDAVSGRMGFVPEQVKVGGASVFAPVQTEGELDLEYLVPGRDVDVPGLQSFGTSFRIS